MTASAVLLGSPLVGVALPASAVSPTVTWTQSGPFGGGYTSVIASNNKGTMIAGGDTTGLYRSTDAGNTWVPVNDGAHRITGMGQQYTRQDLADIASIVYVPNAGGSTGRWYAAAGHKNVGAVLVSTDDGITWRPMSGGYQPFFEGSNTSRGGLGKHPRSTGALLAADSTGTWLYAGSFDAGVFRCKLGATATTCADRADGHYTKIGLAATWSDPQNGQYRYIRSIALNTKITPNRLFVATVDVTITANVAGTPAPKVYYLDNPVAAPDVETNPPNPPVWNAIPSAPAGVEELKYVGSVNGTKQYLYAVGKNGLSRVATEASGVAPQFVGITTKGLLSGLGQTGEDTTRPAYWSAVDGVATASGSRIVLTSGYTAAPGFTTGRTAYLDVTDSGSPGTLTPLDRTGGGSTDPYVNLTIPGTSLQWDLLRSRSKAVLGQPQFLGSSVLVESVSGTPTRLWVAGRQGIYRTGWQSSSSFAKWDPAVNGLVNTFTYGVTQDPTGAGRIAWPDADLIAAFTTGSQSSHTLAGGSRCEPANLEPGTAAMSVQYQSNGTVWLSSGAQPGSDYSKGQLWFGTVTDTGCTWTDSGLAAAVGDATANKSRKISAFSVTGSGASTVVWAYLAGKGLARGVGTPGSMTWSMVPATNLPSPNGIDDNPESTKGVSLIVVGSNLILARPGEVWGSAAGADVCAINPTASAVACRHVTTTIGSPISGSPFNYLVPHPLQSDRVFWSFAGGSGIGGQAVNTIDLTTAQATQVTDLVGGPMTVATNDAGQKQLVVVQGNPQLQQPLLYRKNLTTNGAFEPFTVSGADYLSRAASESTGVLMTKTGPAAGSWRVYVSTLGTGVFAGSVSNF